MTPPRRPSSKSNADRNFIRDLASTMRRMKADEGFNDKGIRTLWHRGRVRTELLTWESVEEVILKHELTFAGLVVEYKDGNILRTGTMPLSMDSTSGGGSAAALIEMDAAINRETLELASELLRHVPERDYYVQHLLKHVNDAMRRKGFDDSKTLVAVEHYSKLMPLDEDATKPGAMSRRTKRRLLWGTISSALTLLLAGTLVWILT